MLHLPFVYGMGEIRIITLNVRGLKSAQKRKIVYEFLLSYNFDVCLVQEAHLRDERDVALFTEEWKGGEASWSIGGVHGTGVGVLCGDKDIRIIESFTVIQGRVMVVDIDKNGTQCRIINVYAQVEHGLRKDLFQKMDTCFLTRKDIIVGGDFNCSLEREKFSLPFRTFIKKYGLIDVMGKLLGKQVGYTWKNTRGVKSRLDYILVGKKCKIIEGKTMPALFTDHQAVDVELEIVGPDFGKGYWKFNNDVLAEKAYREGFMKIFPIWAEMKSLYSNNVVWWEDMKKKNQKVYGRILYREGKSPKERVRHNTKRNRNNLCYGK